ncbi:MAG: beta-glucuronidase, partial [Bacteroidales bacterium]|nr:beta-glucuronidase [Bacteroidales bacterium]
MRSIITLITAIILAETLKAQTINLSGTWQFSTDSIDWSETIQLPGSMLENRKGEPVSINTQWTASIYDSSYYYNPHWAAFRQPGEIKLPFFLTPDYHYIGKAWYKRTIDIDNKYPDAILFLERVHIASSLYINGQYIGTQNSLSVPHRYPVGEHLHAGKNEILICIDNDPDLVGVGKDSHSISDQTQGNWNGIVGKIAIETKPKMPPYPTDSTFRKFEIRGKMFYVNNRKTFLRGTVDNCNFPLTGYPPMDKESWIKIFAQCQEYGFNHVRFHSYCPPEAAFLAADSLNIILQVEGPSWPNHGVRLGVGEKVDTYLWDELDRIIKEYGHHPSFCMLSAGNEPRGKWTQWVEKFTEYWSNSDSRRVYTGASVGWGWAWLPKNPYHVKAGARGLSAWNSEIPNTMDDHRDRIDSISVPFVCHELGQWCAFPNIADTTKYTGVYKAGNLSIFDYQMKRNGIESMSEKFHYSSGKLQLLCYKYEIEKVLRTPNYAGYPILSLNDHTGQRTTHVEMTN